MSELKQLKEFRLRANHNGDLTIKQSQTEWIDYCRLDAIQTLHLDIDIEQNTFSLLQWIIPNVVNFSINITRVCCLCTDVPEYIDNRPKSNVSTNSAQQENSGNSVEPNRVPDPNEPPEPNQPNEPDQPPVDIREMQIVEENCEKCCQNIIQIMSQWNQLTKLTITGEKCKDLPIKTLETYTNLNCISFVSCFHYSLLTLFQTAYLIANNKDQQQTLTVKIDSTSFHRIMKLPLEPRNLKVITTDPIV